MFLRTYVYSLLCSVRQKYQLFWCIAFPILLGTLFKVSFGDVNETQYMFHQIPVAYVECDEAQEEFESLLKQLESEEELIELKKVEEKEAEELLRNDEVKGIFKNGAEIVLVVKEEGIDTSILKSIQEQYEQIVTAFTNIAKEHPEKLEVAAEEIDKQWNYLKEGNVADGDMDMMKDYFYALIAMNCLYGCFSGLSCAVAFKANLSALAARRVVASTNRFAILLPEVLAKITSQFICSIIGAAYLQYALGINLGEETGRIVLIILAGSAIGVMNGVFIGSIGKLKEKVKEGICIGVTMVGCFLAGLMVGNMYQIVEEYAPIINRINPAALIVKAFYSLNIYDTYTRYNQCMITLFGLVVFLCIGSYLLVRRERYASI